MAKVKRSVLKKLIKECLVEILIEGINSEPGVEALVEAVAPRPSSPARRDRYDAEVSRIEKQRKMLDSKKVEPRINEATIASMTSDDLMADIFRDTASTTLVEQGMSNNERTARPVAVDNASKIVQENDLQDLFEGAGNWAALAFDNNEKNSK